MSDVIGIINKIAPFRFAEEWDNVGLQVGDPSASAERILIALDPCMEAVEYARATGCSLLLTHHPLLFKPMKRISRQDPVGRVVCRALETGLSVVSLHTNFDIASGGVNDLLAERLGVTGCEPLQVTCAEDLVKLVVFVPHGHEEIVLGALSRFSRTIGNYADCSFSASGTGTFRPLEGAAPFIGSTGDLASVPEMRLEMMLHRADAASAVAAMKKVHPYEEPACDLYPLINQGQAYGLGRIGTLPAAVSLREFAGQVKERLGVPNLRFVGAGERPVRRVALCGGSGVSLLKDARIKGADVLVTGDVKYHDARDAEAHGIALIDAGHFATERLMIGGLAGFLGRELPSRGFAAELHCFDGEREPFVFV